MKVDPKKVEAEWNKVNGESQAWHLYAIPYRQRILSFVEACCEPAGLTEADYAELFHSRCGPYRWQEVDDADRARWRNTVDIVRRYTPPSLPTKLARAIEALGDAHPEAVRILKEAADGLETT